MRIHFRYCGDFIWILRLRYCDFDIATSILRLRYCDLGIATLLGYCNFTWIMRLYLDIATSTYFLQSGDTLPHSLDDFCAPLSIIR